MPDKPNPNITRTRYPEDEAKNPWLSMLLDAYAVADSGIAMELALEEEKQGRQPGCQNGCCNCCIKSNVPVTELELKGIRWFAVEKLTGDARSVIEKQLRDYKSVPHCPFLANSRCAVYPVRPLACRIFFVFGKPCESPDNIGEARRDDIWTHSRGLAKKVGLILLPYFGIEEESDREFAFDIGYLTTQMTLFRNQNWEEVAEEMAKFDSE